MKRILASSGVEILLKLPLIRIRMQLVFWVASTVTSGPSMERVIRGNAALPRQVQSLVILCFYATLACAVATTWFHLCPA